LGGGGGVAGDLLERIAEVLVVGMGVAVVVGAEVCDIRCVFLVGVGGDGIGDLRAKG
jgi:hypothetical protein